MMKKKMIKLICILLVTLCSCTYLPHEPLSADKREEPPSSNGSDNLNDTDTAKGSDTAEKTDTTENTDKSDSSGKKTNDSGTDSAYIMTMFEERLVLEGISDRFYLDLGENRVFLSSFYEPMFEIDYGESIADLKYESLYKVPRHYKVRLMGNAVGEETLVIRSKRYKSLTKTVTIKVFEYDDPLPEIPDYIVFDSAEPYTFDCSESLMVEVCDNSGGNGQFLYHEDGALKSHGKRDGAAKLKISMKYKPNKYKYVFAFAVSKISDNYYESYFEDRRICERNELSYLEDKMFHFVKSREELFDIYFAYSNANVPNKLLDIDFDRYEILFINNYHSSCYAIGTIYSDLEFDAVKGEFSMKTYTYDGESSGDYHESIEFVVIPKEEIPEDLDTSQVNEYKYSFDRVWGWVN